MKGFFKRGMFFSPVFACIAALCLFSNSPVFSSTMSDTSIEAYFTDLKQDFDKMAASPVLKKPKLKSINWLFVTTLKRHQPIYSFMRTNAKGVMVNEVIRGQVPEKVKKDIKEQEWFKRISKTATEYYGFTFIEENGRYYLFWVNPILGPKKRFMGAVVAKIDLWDCFHDMSKETTDPFLIKLGGKSLYSDKWKGAKNTLEKTLDVPGVEKISLVTEKPVAADSSLTSGRIDTGAVAAVAPALLNDKPGKKAKSAKGFFAKNKLLVIICGIVILIIIIILLVRFYSWLSNVFTMRSINKSDDDPFGRR